MPGLGSLLRHRPDWIGGLPHDQRRGLAQARQSGIEKGTSPIRARRGRGLSGRTSTGDTDAAGLLRLAWSADVEVLQGVVAVVADVEDLVVGQPTDGSLGVSLLGDMHPQGGAALTGVPK